MRRIKNHQQQQKRWRRRSEEYLARIVKGFICKSTNSLTHSQTHTQTPNQNTTVHGQRENLRAD